MLKRGAPLLFAVTAWFGLLKGLPETRPFFWFPAVCAAAGLSFFLLTVEKRKDEYEIAFLFSLLLAPAGIIQAFHLEALRPLYFILVLAMAYYFRIHTILTALVFFSLQIILSYLNLIPGLRTFLGIPDPLEAALLAAFIMLTAGAASFLLEGLRSGRDRAESSLSALRENARTLSHETPMDNLGSEETLAHYLASMLKTDEEIRELMVAIKHAVFADAASLFIPDREGFTLRCSTEESDGIDVSGGGLVASCIRDKKTCSIGDVDEKKVAVGYSKELKVSSIICVPIIEGSSLTGVLTIDSSRRHAFNEPERQSVERFATQVGRIMERERIYFMIKRDVSGLQILREQSANLITKLDVNELARKLCAGAQNIAGSHVYFFVAEGTKFRLIYHNTREDLQEHRYSFEPTIVHAAVENRKQLYFSDVREYSRRNIPLGKSGVLSVLATPLVYEGKLLGLLLMLSEEAGFLDSRQRNLLEVLCNQAAISLYNVTLHSEIERLATRDGLTGLLNHRVFQEKLTGELKRQGRISGPLALILTDIDFFKKVNDTYGHPVGDVVLTGVSKVIRETVRDVDIAARYGGEEFAVILPDTDGAGARIIAERLRNAVQEKTFSADGKNFKVTISMGIAVSPFDARRKEELIEKADQALYHAKHNGRNQSVLWSSIG